MNLNVKRSRKYWKKKSSENSTNITQILWNLPPPSHPPHKKMYTKVNYAENKCAKWICLCGDLKTIIIGQVVWLPC